MLFAPSATLAAGWVMERAMDYQFLLWYWRLLAFDLRVARKRNDWVALRQIHADIDVLRRILIRT